MFLWSWCLIIAIITPQLGQWEFLLRLKECLDLLRTEMEVEPLRCRPTVLGFLRGEEWGVESKVENGGPRQGADSTYQCWLFLFPLCFLQLLSCDTQLGRLPDYSKMLCRGMNGISQKMLRLSFPEIMSLDILKLRLGHWRGP